MWRAASLASQASVSEVSAEVIRPLKSHVLQIKLRADEVKNGGVDGVVAAVRRAVPTGHDGGSCSVSASSGVSETKAAV
ncbi:hypothetical protein NDU88_001768 [Pleurodeles waltl]|uniref:Uncharacterized protein n=1 Tax=Pleurodeles waltl TaxID=8319 RepID=A0AAV7T0J0_PLEWA|nr:hypothetical protein NDU88_001768 [Pleurodeles waltl]